MGVFNQNRRCKRLSSTNHCLEPRVARPENSNISAPSKLGASYMVPCHLC